MSSTRKAGPVTDDLRLYDMGEGGGLFVYNAGSDGFGDTFVPPTPFERGITRADPSEFGMFAGVNNNEMPPPGDDQRPSDNPGGEDSPFDIIMRTIVGQIGNPENVSPEMIAVLNGYLDGSSSSELEEIGRQIVEAGGFEEWLATQDIVLGDPGGVDDTTQTSTEVIFDENGNPVEIVIDPTLITLPPILGTPEDPPAPDPSGGSNSGGGTEGSGDNTIGGGSVEGDGGNQASSSPWFDVRNGEVFVYDPATGEYVPADTVRTDNPGWWEGYLGQNPADGQYDDNGNPITNTDQPESGNNQNTGGGNVTITPGTGGTSGTSSGGNPGGNNQTGGGNQTGNTDDPNSGQNPGSGTSGSGGGTNTGTGPGDGTGGGLFKDAVNKFQGVDATVRFNDPGIPQLIGGRKPQRQSIMGLFEEYL